MTRPRASQARRRSCGGPAAALAVLLLGAAAGCSFDRSALGSWGADGGPPTDGVIADVHADVVVGDGQRDQGGTDGAGDGGPDGEPPDGPPPDDAPPQEDAPPCTAGAHRCNSTGEILEVCSSGVWITEQSCALGCNVGAQQCYTFVPHNVAADALQGTCDWIVDANVTVSTDDASGFPCGADTATLTQTLCKEMRFFKVRSLWVKPGVTLTFSGSRVAAVIAAGTINVEGTIDVSATSGGPGPGGYGGGGRGSAGGGPSGHTAPAGGDNNYGDSGGSGGCHGGVGGNGGRGANAYGNGQCTAYGSGLGTPLCGGGGGGGGRDNCGGEGASGGGGLQLTAGMSVSVSGSILAAGRGGNGGCTNNGYTSGGGGGAGGGVMLEAPSVVVAGVVAANGGGGGGGAYYSDNSGSAGAPGRADRTPAGGGAGGRDGNADYARGGNGGAGATAATNGGDAPDDYENGGGGGGAAGRVTIWARIGTWSLGSATISPDPQVQSITPQ